jgi:uncharacterized membrane protein
VRKCQKDVENEPGLVPYLEAARADVQSIHLESEGFWYSQKRTEIALLHSLDPNQPLRVVQEQPFGIRSNGTWQPSSAPWNRSHVRISSLAESGERQPMKQIMVPLWKALARGLLIVVPVYFAGLLLLKGMSSVAKLVRPLAQLLPDWVPADEFLSLLLVLAICVAIGASVGTRIGRGVRNWIEKNLFERIPGYGLIRSLTQQVAGQSMESTWKAALIEIEEALVPAFVIEELEDGRYTVFVPSIPTPFAGAVYILDRQRVHPVHVPFTDAVRVVSRWGSGAKDLVAAMDRGDNSAERTPER